MKRKVKCSNCEGSGRVRVYHAECSYEYHYVDCAICQGTGEVENVT